MRITLLLLVLINSVGFVRAQNYKSYSGKFKDGNLNYNYILDKKNAIEINGEISYRADNAKINGFYKNNMKDSAWSIDAVNWGSPNKRCSVNIMCGYDEGLLEGPANYSLVFDSTKSLVTKSYFINNRYSGSIKYDYVDSLSSIHLVGQFTKNGLIDGKWSETYNQQHIETNYIKGVLAYYSEKDLSTGELKSLKDNTQFVETYWKYADSNGFAKIRNNLYYGEYTKVRDEFWMKHWSDPKVLDEPNWLDFFENGESKIETSFLEIKIIQCQENTPCWNKWLASTKIDTASDKVYTNLDIQPEFSGGEKALFKFLGKNIKYPSYEKEHNIGGQVIISFVVDEFGAISNVEVMREVKDGPGLNKEALRIISIMPRWEPGIIQGRAVKAKHYLPVRFSISSSNSK